jgi:hypothetical protein
MEFDFAMSDTEMEDFKFLFAVITMADLGHLVVAADGKLAPAF